MNGADLLIAALRGCTGQNRLCDLKKQAHRLKAGLLT
jgi:hypothetical protein